MVQCIGWGGEVWCDDRHSHGYMDICRRVKGTNTPPAPPPPPPKKKPEVIITLEIVLLINQMQHVFITLCIMYAYTCMYEHVCAYVHYNT